MRAISYATVIDELMLCSIRDLKDKLSSSKEKLIITK
jgi:hypothetical protein